MSIERQTMRALKWTGLAKLASQLVRWAATLVVLRLLHPEDYGLMAIASVFIALLANVAELGAGAAVVQAPDIGKEDLARLSGLVTLTNLGIYVVLAAAAPLLAIAFEEERLALVIQVSALQLPLSAIGAIRQALAERELDFGWLAGIEVGSAIISTAVGLGLAWYGAGVWALVGAALSMVVVRSLLLARRGLVWPSFRLAGIGRFLPLGSSVMLSRMAWQVISQSDVLIGARRLGSEAVGTYSVALHLATLPMQKVMGIVNSVALPAVARLQDEPARLRARLIEAARLMTVLSVPVLWGISAVAPEIVGLVLGAKWAAAVFPVQILSLMVPLRMIQTIFSTAIIGTGHSGLNVWATAVSAVVLPASFFVGTHWGVDGLAASWVAAVPVTFVLGFWRMDRAFGIRRRDLFVAVWRPAAAGIAMYLAVLAARAALGPLEALVRVPLLIGAGAISYVAVLQLLDPGIRRDLGVVLRAARS